MVSGQAGSVHNLHLGRPMDADRLLEFFADSGFRVYRSPNGHWYEAGPRFLLGLPSHQPLTLTAGEAREILKRSRAAGLRYVSDEPNNAHPSFQMVATGSDYSLDRLPASTRSKIRRGLKRLEIRRISGKDLATAGYQAFVETLDRQGRRTRNSIRRWREFLGAVDREPGVEVWSAWEHETLAAYLIVFLIDDICELYQGRSRNEYLKHYPNNALVYTVTEEMLVKRGLREVTYGIESLESVPTVDLFKLSMGFVRKPTCQRVVFHPALQLMLKSGVVRKTVQSLASKKEARVFWRKAYGLICFAGLGAGEP